MGVGVYKVCHNGIGVIRDDIRGPAAEGPGVIGRGRNHNGNPKGWAIQLRYKGEVKDICRRNCSVGGCPDGKSCKFLHICPVVRKNGQPCMSTQHQGWNCPIKPEDRNVPH